MNKKELQEYLEQHSSGYQTFITKATDDQLERNKRRAPAKRWNETKMERAVDKMWLEVVTNVFDKLSKQIKSTNKQTWLSFMDEHDIIESFDDSMNELEF